MTPMRSGITDTRFKINSLYHENGPQSQLAAADRNRRRAQDEEIGGAVRQEASGSIDKKAEEANQLLKVKS